MEHLANYDLPVGQADVDQSVPVADRLLGRFGAGSLASLSFDKGFTRTEDRELLGLYVPQVVMPKRGKKDAAEAERESEKKFVALRKLFRVRLKAGRFIMINEMEDGVGDHDVC